MTDDLVKRLRDGVPCCDPDAGNGEGSFYIDDANETMCEAADRIEALTAENERLERNVEGWKAEAKRYCENADYWHTKYETLRDRLVDLLEELQ